MREQDIKKSFESIQLTDDRKDQLIKSVQEKMYYEKQIRRKNMGMKKFRYVAVAAALMVVLSVGVYAAGGAISSWIGSSKSSPDYTSLPTQEECMDKIGCAPVLVEFFSNGYTFTEATIVNNDLQDENENSIEKFKSLSLQYDKGENNVSVTAGSYESANPSLGNKFATVSGVELYYDSYINKFVPEDYQKTEEDKIAEKNGQLVFSYGVDEEETSEVKSLSWEQDGIHYMIQQLDGELSQRDLVDMAKDMINTK